MKPSLRFEIFKRDSFTCRYCGKRSPEAILEVDHVVPCSAGGTDDSENLVTSCYECNRGKSARLLTEIPLEDDPHEKAIVIAEHERQIAELQHWRWKQRDREDRELKKLEKIWASSYSQHWWKPSRVRHFLRIVGFVDVGEALEWTVDHARPWKDRGRAESAWVLFCSICTKRMREQGHEDDSTDAQ